MQPHRTVFRYLALAAFLAVLPAMIQTYAGIGLRVIRSGSMEPTLAPGDAVLIRTVQARQLNEGDIALLLHPNSPEIEAHRLITVDEGNSTVSLVTKGDANPMSDPAVELSPNAAIEQVVLNIPKLGYVISVLGFPLILGGLCALGLVVLIVFEVQDRRRRPVAPTEIPL